jgi:hypothetical protein
MPADVARYRKEEQDHGLARALDHQLIEGAQPAIVDKKPVRLTHRIRNANRSVGAMLSGVVAHKYGHDGLPEDTIHVAFEGIAGQSFGAFLRAASRSSCRARPTTTSARACRAAASSSIPIPRVPRSPRRTSSSATR